MYLRTNYPCTQLDSRCFCVSCCIIISKSWLNQTPAILSSTPERGVHPQPCSQPALLQLVGGLQRLPEKNRETVWIRTLHLLRDLKGFPRIMAIIISLDGAGSKPKLGWAPLMTTSSRDSWAATIPLCYTAFCKFGSNPWGISLCSLILPTSNRIISLALSPSNNCPSDSKTVKNIWVTFQYDKTKTKQIATNRCVYLMGYSTMIMVIMTTANNMLLLYM